jgi:predicted phosphodiesterase
MSMAGGKLVVCIGMKLCIVSDSHDRADALAGAVRAAQAAGAQAVIHCGDVIGTQTLRGALDAGLPMHVIHGNNLGDPVSLARWARDSGGRLQYHGHSHEAGVRQVQNIKGGRTWLVNPGTVAGLAAPATWVLGDLAAMRFDTHLLSL